MTDNKTPSHVILRYSKLIACKQAQDLKSKEKKFYDLGAEALAKRSSTASSISPSVGGTI